jgi:PKHD-type hydroxylase
MILSIADVLSPAALAKLRALAADAPCVDGVSTAGWAAQPVKRNLQLEAGSDQHVAIVQLALHALAANEILVAAALPRSWHAPLVSRYDVGMGYGRHVDDALMGAPPVRTDLSYTLFISEPADYEGGELVLDDAEGEHEYKLHAGALLLYPASYLHRVETVRSGSRLVVVGWIESACPDPRAREILFDLHRARRLVHAQCGRGESFDLLAKCSSNLLRLVAGR